MKSIIGEDAFGQETVTPYGGVWIEMSDNLYIFRMLSVTPYGGVWIEITFVNCKQFVNMSRLMEACGLKLLRR